MKQFERLRIDWVEIPKGDFLTGVSAKQRAVLRENLWTELRLAEIDPLYRGVVESLAHKYQLAGQDKGFKLSDNLTPEEQTVESQFFENIEGNILAAMLDLERLPPQQRVFIETFYIARFPITKEQAALFYASSLARRFGLHRLRNTRKRDLGDMPEDICWLVADVFAHWLGGRLPSIYEWEKAARGIDGRLYPWGDEWDVRRGNFGLGIPPESQRLQEKDNRRTVVDAYSNGVSPYNVWDMVGNGAEWTMTLTPPESPHIHVPLLKGYGYDDPSPEWYWSIAARVQRGFFESEAVGTYRKNIGFRPVLDKWMRHSWPGYHTETNARERN